ncbi:MAG: hypothetical protein ACI4PD_01150 [Butyricicoccus sp.]
MTERIFPRWRLALTALFLLPELLYISQGMTDFFSIALTLLLAPTVWLNSRKRHWFLILLPAFWLLVLCVLRISGLLSGLALTALHPALCGLAFTLAAAQLARHGSAALYQWAYPTAWALGLGCVLALLLGWPQAHDLWFLLLLLLAELGRCAALIGRLQGM